MYTFDRAQDVIYKYEKILHLIELGHTLFCAFSLAQLIRFYINHAALLCLVLRLEDVGVVKPQRSWGSWPTLKPAKPSFRVNPQPTPWSTAGAPCSRMRLCMSSSFSKVEGNTPSIHQWNPRWSPQPTPLQQISGPLLGRLAWVWPSPMHIREPPAYKWLASCPMPRKIKAWKFTSKTVLATRPSAAKRR